jgi:O-glycosyl hydrolase
MFNKWMLSTAIMSLGATASCAAPPTTAPTAPQKMEVQASDPAVAQVLAEGTPLLPPDALTNSRPGAAVASDVQVQGQAFSRARRFEIPAVAGETNAVQININNTTPIVKGDALLALFWARGKAQVGAAPAQVMFMFERSSAPWTKSATKLVRLPAGGEQWRRFAIPFAAQEDYAPGEVMASLRLAFGAQTVDLAGLQVLGFGRTKTLDELQDLAVRLSPLGRVQVRVDRADRRQVMVGLGGNFTGGYRAAYGQPNDAVEQFTRKNLKPAHARLGLSLIEWQPEENGVFATTGKAAGVLKTAGEFAREKVPQVLSVWEAPAWMTGTLDGKKTIPEAKWDATIGALAEFLVQARDRHGAEIEYASFNEPDLGIDLHFSPARMAAFVKRAVPAFQKRGLKTRWLAGDTANGAACVPYTRPQLEDAEARKFLGPVSFHSWDALDASDPTYENIAKLAHEFKRPVWCLESGSDAQAWRTQPAVWPTWDYALKIAQAHVKIIGPARAEVVDFWTYRDDYPVASKEGVGYPSFYVLREIATAFGRGTQVVGARSNSGEVQVLAGVGADKSLRVMLVNGSGVGRAVVSGLAPNASVRILRLDSRTQNRAPNSAAAAGRTSRNGQTDIALPARAVAVLTIG